MCLCLSADVQYFMDYLPLSRQIQVPYALNQCQPGPKPDTYALYFCDQDGAGVFRKLYNDPNCKNSWSDHEYPESRFLFTKKNPFDPIDNRTHKWSCKGENTYVAIDLNCNSDLIDNRKTYIYLALNTTIMDFEHLNSRLSMSCSPNCELDYLCQGNSDLCNLFKSIKYDKCDSWIMLPDQNTLQGKVLGCLHNGSSLCFNQEQNDDFIDISSNPIVINQNNKIFNHNDDDDQNFDKYHQSRRLEEYSTNYIMELLPYSSSLEIPYAVEKCQFSGEKNKYTKYFCDFSNSLYSAIWKYSYSSYDSCLSHYEHNLNFTNSTHFWTNRELLVNPDFSCESKNNDDFIAVDIDCNNSENNKTKESSYIYIVPQACTSVVGLSNSFWFQCSTNCSVSTRYFTDNNCGVSLPTNETLNYVQSSFEQLPKSCEPWYLTNKFQLIYSQFISCSDNGVICNNTNSTNTTSPTTSSYQTTSSTTSANSRGSNYFIDTLDLGNVTILAPYTLGKCQPYQVSGFYMKYHCDQSPVPAGVWRQLYWDSDCKKPVYYFNNTIINTTNPYYYYYYHYLYNSTYGSSNISEILNMTNNLNASILVARTLYSRNNSSEGGHNYHDFYCDGNDTSIEWNMSCNTNSMFTVYLATNVCVMYSNQYTYKISNTKGTCGTTLTLYNNNECNDTNITNITSFNNRDCVKTNIQGLLQDIYVKPNSCYAHILEHETMFRWIWKKTKYYILKLWQ